MPPTYFVWIAVAVAACMCLCERSQLGHCSLHAFQPVWRHSANSATQCYALVLLCAAVCMPIILI